MLRRAVGQVLGRVVHQAQPVLDGELPERYFFIHNLLVRIHFIVVMIRWTGLAPWEFEFPFPGSLTSTFLEELPQNGARQSQMSTLCPRTA